MSEQATILPEDCAAEVRRILRTTIPDADEALTARCIRMVSRFYEPGMSVADFHLRACAPVYSFALKLEAAQEEKYPSYLRSHVLDTLSQCFPLGVPTKAYHACLEEMMQQSEAGDPMHTGAIYAFAARYLKTPQKNASVQWQRLHEAALRRLPDDRSVTRDDFRLTALDALFDPAILKDCPHAGFFRLRLGLDGGKSYSCEEIACYLHLPLTLVHEIEAGALHALTHRHYA